MEFTLFPRSALLQEIKVLVVAHNIPTRLFPDWYVAIATSPVTCPQDSTQLQSTAEVVAECLTRLLKLAASSSQVRVTEEAATFHCLLPLPTAGHSWAQGLGLCLVNKGDDSEDTNESVHTLAPELLIPAETINYLCNAEECASPEDFLRIYLSPSQPALDSGTLRTV
ncbi:testis-expressed protein 47 [Sarcoramphus papa]